MMGKALVSATIIFLVIIGVRKVFRGKVGNSFLYALWMLFALDLLFSALLLAGQEIWGLDISRPKSAFSVMNLMEWPAQKSTAPLSSGSGQNMDENQMERVDENAGQKVPTAITKDSRNETGRGRVAAAEKYTGRSFGQWGGRLFFAWIWLAGFVFLCIRMILAEQRFRARMLENRREAVCQGQKLYIVEKIATPLLFRSRGTSLDIYLPDWILHDEKLVNHAVLHENMHKKHGDIWWNYLRNFLTALYWFYPLVWAAAILSKRDCEYACDSALMKHMDHKERVSYGNSLLTMAKLGKKEDVFSVAAAMRIRKSEMEVRIRMIKHGTEKKKLAVLCCCMILCGAGIAACTDAEHTSAVGKAGESEADSVTDIHDSVTDTDGRTEGTSAAKTQNASSKVSIGQAEQISVKAAEYQITDTSGADAPRICYEDQERMIFSGYFGLFVYDRQEEQIIQSLDLTSIGCNHTQGDDYCEILASADGTEVYLHKIRDNTMYRYLVDTNRLERVPFELPQELYVREDREREQNSGIRIGGGTIGDLTYRYEDRQLGSFVYIPLFYAPCAPYKSCEYFEPEDIHDIRRVWFYMGGKEYVLEDAKKLKLFEAYVSQPGAGIEGRPACPFYDVMYLERKDGTCGKIYPATDSCAVYRTRDSRSGMDIYYEYAKEDNREFWRLFGLEQ